MTLAVLPFTNIRTDPQREYLAAGLTEETSASLAQIDPEPLIVKGRTLRYKGTTKTAVEIRGELSVDYLVESTIRVASPRRSFACAIKNMSGRSPSSASRPASWGCSRS